MNFSDLGLAAPLLSALAEAGFTAPTQVQQSAIPAALAGSDLLVSSQTGSGKTAAFMLPSLQRLLTPATAAGKGPRILVLAPTRELAIQVTEAADQYARGVRRFTSATLVGGAPYAPQMRKLARPLDLIVATPGRLIDHIEAGRVDFSRLEMLILDEADRMLDMGFLADIERIVECTPTSRQTMLFSATLDGVVGDLARRLTRDPKRIDVESTATTKADIEQVLMYADDLAHKSKLLDALLRRDDMDQCVVFASTRQSTEDLREQLAANGFSVAALHGDMQQGQRNRTLNGMRAGRTKVLVATDVAARGIDVAGITHVINFDAPRQAEDYVHRIGRTGRAGRSGMAVTLLKHDEHYRVRLIERYTGQPIRIDVIAGLEPRVRPARPSGKFGGKPGGKPGARFGGRPGERGGKPTGRPGRPGEWAGARGNGAGARGEGFQQRSEGFQPRSEGYERRSDGFKPRSEGFGSREGGFGSRDKAFGKREGGSTQREGGSAQRDAGFAQRDNGFAARGDWQGRPSTDRKPRPAAEGWSARVGEARKPRLAGTDERSGRPGQGFARRGNRT